MFFKHTGSLVSVVFIFFIKTLYNLQVKPQKSPLFPNTSSREKHTYCRTYYTQIEIIQRDVYLLFSNLLCVDYTSNTKRNKLIYGGSYEHAAPRCRTPDLLLSAAALCTSHSYSSTFYLATHEKQHSTKATPFFFILWMDAKIILHIKGEFLLQGFPHFSPELQGRLCAEWAVEPRHKGDPFKTYSAL